MSTNIFAVSCIELIEPQAPSGMYLAGQKLTFVLTPLEIPVVVEVVQGGYIGDGRHFCINLERDPVIIELDLTVRTAPIHLICYNAVDIPGGVVNGVSSNNGCWQKNTTIQVFSAFIDDRQKESVESIMGSYIAIATSTGINTNNNISGDINNNIAGNINVALDDNISINNKYTNIKTDEDPLILLLAWFYFLFGLFLVIRFAFKIGDR